MENKYFSRFSRSRNNFEKKKEYGFTLIEIIIFVTVSLLIISISYSLFVLSQRVFQKREINLEILQNGRVILDRTSREVRQAKEIATSLPDVPDNPENPPAEEILFQDGHLPLIIESGFPQAVDGDSVTLCLTSSSIDDYYKDMFIKITDGLGEGQIRKIIDYDGVSKVAMLDEDWTTLPDASSTYKIDSSYYYIRYHKVNSDLLRKIIVYYFPDDPATLEDETDSFVPWNSIDSDGNSPTLTILEDEIIGEYVKNLSFWGSKTINISLDLEKNNIEFNLRTMVLGRNL